MDNDNFTEIMTVSDVAEYLHLAEKTVVRMAQRGEIPAAKVANQWRFMRSVIRDWLASQMQRSAYSEAENESGGITGQFLPIPEVVKPELMNLDIQPGKKQNVLAQLVEPLKKHKFAKNPGVLLSSLIDRERITSTAVGHHIAVPHPRRPLSGMFEEPGIAIGVCREGTDFEAIDDQLVHLFFLICATRDAVHLQLMARISWLTRREETIKKIINADSADDVLDIIKQTIKQDVNSPESNTEV